jgi:serine/threonine protein phosphatase PrpC
MRIRSAAHTDIGKIREENEDRFLCDDDLQLYAVADGIGGLAGGAQAAEEAITQLTARVRQLPANDVWDFRGLLLAINEHVARIGQRIDETYGIGTTLTVARLYMQQLHLAHVGDSSCFLLRDENLEKLTVDHTVENEFRARHGHGAALFLNPRTRSALTRCIGQPIAPEVDVLMRPLNVGDRILLCSDGLNRFAKDFELAHLLAVAETPEVGLTRMIELANTRGGLDNATGVLLFVDEI